MENAQPSEQLQNTANNADRSLQDDSPASSEGNEPSIELYQRFIDQHVKMVSSDGAHIQGVCRALDGYLSAILEDATIISPSTETATLEPLKLKSCYVRGGCIEHVEKADS